MTPSLLDRVMQEIVYPTVQAMAAEGCPFKGVLYFGLMLTERGPMVIEYNSRFGDPETQAILPLLKTPLSQVMLAVIEERLGEMEVAFSQESAVCVVLASGGYPGPYEKGKTIHGIQEALAEGAIVYHAGTALCKDGYATGGRPGAGGLRRWSPPWSRPDTEPMSMWICLLCGNGIPKGYR